MLIRKRMCVSGEINSYSREEIRSVHKKQAGTIVGRTSFLWCYTGLCAGYNGILVKESAGWRKYSQTFLSNKQTN